jgi:DNA-binding NarL/FixJ family response regulator
MNPIRILLADHHTVMRNGLRLLLERQRNLTVVAEASDGRESVRLAEEFSPDVVVMDIAMPNLNGIEASRQIIASNPDIAIVILSMHSDESYVIRALKAGARAYLLKDSAEGPHRRHSRHHRRQILLQPCHQPDSGGRLRAAARAEARGRHLRAAHRQGA